MIKFESKNSKAWQTEYIYFKLIFTKLAFNWVDKNLNSKVGEEEKLKMNKLRQQGS